MLRKSIIFNYVSFFFIRRISISIVSRLGRLIRNLPKKKKNCQLFATFFKLTCWKVARVREFEGPSIIMLVGADRADNIKDSKTFDRISLRKISKYSVNISRYATLTAVHVIDSCLWRFKMSAFPVTINKNSILN